MKQSVSVGYFLHNDASGEKRAPSLKEVNDLITKDVQSMLGMYTSEYLISKLGVQKGTFVVNFEYEDRSDGLVKAFLMNPDDDGNYYIGGQWGWRAVQHSQATQATRRLKPLRRQTAKASPKVSRGRRAKASPKVSRSRRAKASPKVSSGRRAKASPRK
jgi:hypothetical protein